MSDGAEHSVALAGAAATRVSNELGAGRPQAARPIVGAATGLVVIVSLSSAALCMAARCSIWSTPQCFNLCQPWSFTHVVSLSPAGDRLLSGNS